MIMDRLYGGVCYAGIDTDPELKYPKGAGRVAFSNQQSYIAAISARFVQLQHNDIDKRVSEFARFTHSVPLLKESSISTTSEVFTVIPMAELCLSPPPCIRAFITTGISANYPAQPTITKGRAWMCNDYGLWLSPDRCFNLQTHRDGLIIVVPYTCISSGAVLLGGYFGHAGQLQQDRS